MTLSVFQASILDEAGNVVPSASVEVRVYPALTLATVYDNSAGTGSPLSNPLAADSDGFVRFYAAAGVYKLTASIGGDTRVWDRVLLGVPDAALSANVPLLDAASNEFDGEIVAGLFTGSGAGLTDLPSADLSNLNASNLTSGTVPDARFPATLPAINGSALTNLNGSNVASGTVADARLSANVALLDRDPQTFSGVTRLSSTASSASAPALRVGATGSTAASAIMSAIRAGLAALILRNTSNSVEAFLQASTGSVQVGSNTNHAVEVLVNGSIKVTINSSGDVTATTFTGSGAALTALNASNLGSGTVPDARFPSTLPTLNGSALTALTAANVTGSHTLSDGVLSTNVPLLNTANAFTGTLGVTVSGDAFGTWNGTSTNGAYLTFKKSGTDIGYFGSRKAIHGTGNATDWELYGVNTLYLVGGAINLNGVDATDFARLSQSNTFLTASANNSQTIDTTSTSFTPRIIFRQGGAFEGQIAIQSAGSTTITGGTNGDLATSAFNALAFSADNGSSLAFRIDGSNNFNFYDGTVTTNNASAAEVGKTGAPSRSISASTNTAASDQGGTIKMTGGSGQTFTLDGDPPAETFVVLLNKSGNAWTIACSGTLTWASTAGTGSRTLADKGMAVAFHEGSGSWTINGGGLS